MPATWRRWALVAAAIAWWWAIVGVHALGRRHGAPAVAVRHAVLRAVRVARLGAGGVRICIRAMACGRKDASRGRSRSSRSSPSPGPMSAPTRPAFEGGCQRHGAVAQRVVAVRHATPPRGAFHHRYRARAAYRTNRGCGSDVPSAAAPARAGHSCAAATPHRDRRTTGITRIAASPEVGGWRKCAESGLPLRHAPRRP